MLQAVVERVAQLDAGHRDRAAIGNTYDERHLIADAILRRAGVGADIDIERLVAGDGRRRHPRAATRPATSTSAQDCTAPACRG